MPILNGNGIKMTPCCSEDGADFILKYKGVQKYIIFLPWTFSGENTILEKSKCIFSGWIDGTFLQAAKIWAYQSLTEDECIDMCKEKELCNLVEYTKKDDLSGRCVLKIRRDNERTHSTSQGPHKTRFAKKICPHGMFDIISKYFIVIIIP